ncbi:MAG TPA: sugar ABC transporter permease [Firmicutes bacterium]|nr:sugar ABC transporter permease [Bacillota bacterium]
MKWSTKKKLIGFAFVLPWIVGFLLFTLYPLIETIRYSFSDVRVQVGGVRMTGVGLDNYVQVLMGDTAFLTDLPGYLEQILLYVPMTLVFSIILSLLLNRAFAGKKLFRALFFLPVVLMSGPLIANIQSLDADTLSGVKTFFLYQLIDRSFPEFLAVPLLYIFDNIIMILWYCGVQILIFLAGLQKVDSSVYEAARVDGASRWQQFWKITLPTLRPFILINGIYAIVDISNSSTNSITAMIKESMFQTTKGYGFAAAASYLYFLVMLLILLLAVLLLGRGMLERRPKPEKRPKPKRRAKAKRAAKSQA